MKYCVNWQNKKNNITGSNVSDMIFWQIIYDQDMLAQI